MTDVSRQAPPLPQAQHITSRDNALLKDLRRLSHETTAYRKQGRFWTEGDHLCRAAVARGFKPAVGVFSESKWPEVPVEYTNLAIKNIVIRSWGCYDSAFNMSMDINKAGCYNKAFSINCFAGLYIIYISDFNDLAIFYSHISVIP